LHWEEGGVPGGASCRDLDAGTYWRECLNLVSRLIPESRAPRVWPFVATVLAAYALVDTVVYVRSPNRRCPTRYSVQVELTLLKVLIQLLDPRTWKRRIMQIGVFSLVGTYIATRASQQARAVRVVADERHAERRRSIRQRNHDREIRHHRRALEGIQPLSRNDD
jgi:hypothetical protein